MLTQQIFLTFARTKLKLLKILRFIKNPMKVSALLLWTYDNVIIVIVSL